MKKSFVYLFVLFTLVLASCQAATPTAAPTAADNGSSEQPTEAAPAATEPVATGEEPEVCATDEWGCAKIPAGQTIKLGMGAPMTGDYASFGVDISQGALLAIKDAEPVDGFVFELVAQDTQGTPEGGASVANKLVSDPTVVAIPGHIFSGSTEAAMPIYEKAGLPMLSPSATNPPLTQQGSKVFNRIAFT
ncbi:MAG: ABC transporter substrate-binding protein, partial [Anaerolineaceae bacterium]